MVGFRKPRKIRPTEKDVPKGYDSKWEYTLHSTVLQKWNHHSEKIPYVVDTEYLKPDTPNKYFKDNELEQQFKDLDTPVSTEEINACQFVK